MPISEWFAAQNKECIMALSDSIGDFLTRIRNAQLAMHKTTRILFSRILKDERYILDYQKEVAEEVEENGFEIYMTLLTKWIRPRK
ncbi:30S ribosomal protein S8 domain protein [Onchocerca flexuosa]|uniref:30S ribosomal protein S8 domain protein n=1 Tax=Onchocerca flexuosa TaxID=387005 RepID=A0A238BR91_9BILA|nr:30S ribosomal protein S8 domain protein [Onchocerca flexuosa]